jgi:dTDP-4-dehydrorhamnose reductase
MKILVLGANGMAGHLISLKLLSFGHQVYTLTRTPLNIGININSDYGNLENLEKIIINGNFDFIVNAAGVLIENSVKKPMEAVRINSYLPLFLESITKNKKTKIIQLSTDCVFS